MPERARREGQLRYGRSEWREVLAVREVGGDESEGGADEDVLPMVYVLCIMKEKMVRDT